MTDVAPAQPAEDVFEPERVRFKQFRLVRRAGLDPDEVGAFLGQLAEHLVDLRDRERALRAIAENLQRENDKLRGLISEGTAAPMVDPNTQAHDALVDAQLRAREIVAHAEERRAEILSEARQRAARIHEQAERMRAGQADTSTMEGQLNVLLGFPQQGLGGTLVERADAIVAAETKLADERQALIAEAEEAMVAAQQVTQRFSSSETSDDEATQEVPVG